MLWSRRRSCMPRPDAPMTRPAACNWRPRCAARPARRTKPVRSPNKRPWSPRRTGHLHEAEQAVAAMEAELEDGPADPHLRAELLLMRARLARAAGQMDEAVRHARDARDAALQAVAPVSYFAASAELAEALQSRGD